MRLKRAEYHLFKRLEQLPESERKLCMYDLEEYVQARIAESTNEIMEHELCEEFNNTCENGNIL